MIFAKEGVRVEFVISRGVQEENKSIFDHLFSRKEMIDRAFGAALEWRRMDDKKQSIIASGAQFDGYNQTNWTLMISWLVDNLRRMEGAFRPEIASLRKLLQTKFRADIEQEAGDA